MSKMMRIMDYNCESEPVHKVTDIRFLSSDDEVIFYELKPVRIPQNGMEYEDWNCFDSIRIYASDFETLLLKSIEEIFPVNDPDPNGFGVQQVFDSSFTNFFGLEDWNKLIGLLRKLGMSSDNETRSFYDTVICYMEGFVEKSEFFCVESNR